MKKHKAKAKLQKNDDGAVTLGDLLDQELKAKLKEQQKSLKAEEERRKELEAQRKKEERKQKEKSKSFEELLEESELNWKEYK